MLVALLFGFVFGFVGSMPIAGPISILVLSRGLENRFNNALHLALGAALAEAVYAYLAFWGFSELLASHPWIDPASRAAAAVILFGLGLRFALKKKEPRGAPPPDPAVGNKRNFALGFTLTLLNPTLIATWTGAIAVLYATGIVAFSGERALPFSIGASLGIFCWFALLLLLLRRFKQRLKSSAMIVALRFMGFGLMALGLVFAYGFAVAMLAL